MTLSLIHKAYYLIGFLCFTTCYVFGQDQKLSDSLIMIYEAGTYQGDELSLLKRIVDVETNPERQLKYSELLIEKASKDSLSAVAGTVIRATSFDSL